VIENFIGTNSGRNFLEGLKRKDDIFIENKNIFNFFLIYSLCLIGFTFPTLWVSSRALFFFQKCP